MKARTVWGVIVGLSLLFTWPAVAGEGVESCGFYLSRIRSISTNTPVLWLSGAAAEQTNGPQAKDILIGLIKKHFPDTAPTYLDFEKIEYILPDGDLVVKASLILENYARYLYGTETPANVANPSTFRTRAGYHPSTILKRLLTENFKEQFSLPDIIDST